VATSVLPSPVFGERALVQHHAADQLHNEVAHVEHAASSFADDRESFHQNLIQHFLQGVVFLFVEPLLAVHIGFGFVFISGVGSSFRRTSVREASQPLLDALPEFTRFGA
jgi:hypothetical protein